MQGLQGKDLLLGWELARAEGRSQREYASEVGLSCENLKNRLRLARLLQQVPRRPELFANTLGKPMDLVGDFVIVGDVHVPYTDYEFTQRINQVGERMLDRPRSLLLAGDIFSMESFSSYPAVVAQPTWAQERDALRQLFSEWLQVFDNIYGIMGNHDRRLQKWVAGAFDETDIVSLVYSGDKIKWSNFGYCSVTSNGVRYHVTHPKNYSRVNLSVAEQLSLKHQSNVITHHEHHCGKAIDRYGHFVIVNNGCLADASKMAYTRMDDSTAPAMCKAFCLLKNGVVTLYSDNPMYTDWSEYDVLSV